MYVAGRIFFFLFFFFFFFLMRLQRHLSARWHGRRNSPRLFFPLCPSPPHSLSLSLSKGNAVEFNEYCLPEVCRINEAHHSAGNSPTRNCYDKDEPDCGRLSNNRTLCESFDGRCSYISSLYPENCFPTSEYTLPFCNMSTTQTSCTAQMAGCLWYNETCHRDCSLLSDCSLDPDCHFSEYTGNCQHKEIPIACALLLLLACRSCPLARPKALPVGATKGLACWRGQGSCLLARPRVALPVPRRCPPLSASPHPTSHLPPSSFSGGSITNTTYCESVPYCDVYPTDDRCYPINYPDCSFFGTYGDECEAHSTCVMVQGRCEIDNDYHPPFNCSDYTDFSSCHDNGCSYNPYTNQCEVECQHIYTEDRCESYNATSCFFSNLTGLCEHGDRPVPCKLGGGGGGVGYRGAAPS